MRKRAENLRDMVAIEETIPEEELGEIIEPENINDTNETDEFVQIPESLNKRTDDLTKTEEPEETFTKHRISWSETMKTMSNESRELFEKLDQINKGQSDGDDDDYDQNQEESKYAKGNDEFYVGETENQQDTLGKMKEIQRSDIDYDMPNFSKTKDEFGKESSEEIELDDFSDSDKDDQNDIRVNQNQLPRPIRDMSTPRIKSVKEMKTVTWSPVCPEIIESNAEESSLPRLRRKKPVNYTEEKISGL